MSGLVEVVSGQQHGRAVGAQVLHQVPELATRLRVESRGGLVQEEEGGTAGDRHPDVEPPAPAPGQAREPGAGIVAQADLFDGGRDVGGRGVEAGDMGDGLGDGELLHVFRRLGDDAYARPPGARAVLGVLPQNGDGAGAGPSQTLKNLDGGGLACTIGAQESQNSAGGNIEVQAGQDVLVPVGFGEVVDLDRRRMCHGSQFYERGTIPATTGRATAVSTDRWTPLASPSLLRLTFPQPPPSPRSVHFRVEIGPVPRACCSPAVLRCAACSFRPQARRARLDVELAGPNRTDLSAGRSECAWRVSVVSILHIGDRDLRRAGAGSCWNDALFWRSSRMVVGLPCAVRGSVHMGAGPLPLLR